MDPFRVPRPPREQAAVDRDRPHSAHESASEPASDTVPPIFSTAGYPIESRVRGRRPAGKTRERKGKAGRAEGDNGVFEPPASSIPEPPYATLNQLLESAKPSAAGAD